LIVVANRGPVSFRLDAAGRRVGARGGGGLAPALRSLLRHHDVTWIASAMTDEDRVVARASAGEPVAETTHDGSPYHLRLLEHDAEAYDRFYNVVANPLLWFIQHSLWGLATEPTLGPEFASAWHDGYRAVNDGFAAAVVDELDRREGAAVFFHDYHLYLAPRAVREARPEARLAQFVHIPWPQTEAWSILPEPYRLAIHDGLLANDVVGFHTARWRRNFEESTTRIAGAELRADGSLGHRGRRIRVANHPLGVDAGEFAALSSSATVEAREHELERDRPELLVVRVDRTDPSKNVVRGFEAFALLLERRPDLHGRVGMLALLDPSRQEIPAYAAYLAAIEAAAAAVNARFGSSAWLPVDLRVADDFPLSVAAYKQFDVLFVNAVYDGLNLVAKEGPLVNRRDGVLVLSENAGAHEELREWALTVNPFDISGQADALEVALSMPAAERRRRAEGMQAHLWAHDVAEWAEAQLLELSDLDGLPSRP
jgi:trehalose 6-phosphate synthase